LLIEFQLFPEKLKEVVNRCLAEPQDFCAVEAEVIGADHQAFGAALAAKWKFPPALRCVISHHHNPANLREEYQKVASLVCVADTLCCEQQQGLWLSAAAQQVDPEMLKLIGVDEAHLAEIKEQLPEAIEEAERVFSD
jgi:HD-like signal output (HDOD) protein